MTFPSSCLRDKLNLATEVVQSSHEALDGLGAAAAREVVGAEILVFGTIFEHVVSGGEHGGGNREDGFLGAAPGLQAQELGLKVGALDSDRGPGGSDEGGLEPRGALTHAC